MGIHWNTFETMGNTLGIHFNTLWTYNKGIFVGAPQIPAHIIQMNKQWHWNKLEIVLMLIISEFGDDRSVIRY